jgi:phosphate transport system substrate-binding protein
MTCEPTRRFRRILLASTFFLSLAVDTGAAAPTSVDPGLPAYVPPATLSGELTCAGGDTMQALTESWGRTFVRFNPLARITVARDARLSADGFAALLAGRVSCVTFVREPFPSERAAFVERFEREALLVNVANGSYATKGGTHAIAVYVNAANPIAHLDLTQLDAIFSKTRRRGAPNEVTRWGQLGLGAEWTDRPVHVYSMLRGRESGNPPGIVNFLQQRVLLGGALRDDVREQRDTPGETALQAIVHRVAADPAGIGYSGFGFAEPGVKSVALAETAKGPFYAGSPAEVARRDYPLGRRIYLLFNSPIQHTSAPIVREFLRFILSREGQQIVADDDEGFIPLSESQAAEARTAMRTGV